MEIATGIIGGGLITWLAAWWYYRKASRDLLSEASELRRLNRLMLLGMENAGWVELTKDEKGNILGFKQTIHVESVVVNSQVGTPNIIDEESPKT